MSTLFVVRHAQASFFTEDYDRLSPLGIDQARLLGEYIAGQGLRFDRIVSGPRRRHMDTALIFSEACQQAGVAVPEVETFDGLDEFPADELVAHASEVLSKSHAVVGTLFDRFQHTEEDAARRRAFQKLMETITRLWVRAAFTAPGIEPWVDFCARVNAVIDTLVRESGSGQRVAVFTSGGPAAVTVQRALDNPPEKTLELIWTLRNAAIIEFLYTRDRFTLGAFNLTPHLTKARLWTYR